MGSWETLCLRFDYCIDAPACRVFSNIILMLRRPVPSGAVACCFGLRARAARVARIFPRKNNWEIGATIASTITRVAFLFSGDRRCSAFTGLNPGATFNLLSISSSKSKESRPPADICREEAISYLGQVSLSEHRSRWCASSCRSSSPRLETR